MGSHSGAVGAAMGRGCVGGFHPLGDGAQLGARPWGPPQLNPDKVSGGRERKRETHHPGSCKGEVFHVKCANKYKAVLLSTSA